MAVIGNTFVGYNPADAQLADAMGNASRNISASMQNRRQMTQDRSTDAFTELDGQVKAVYEEYGPQAFQPAKLVPEGTPNAQRDPGTGDWYVVNPYYEQTKKLLDATSVAFNKATGGDPNAYWSGIYNTPSSPEMRGRWEASIGTLLARGQEQAPLPPAPPAGQNTPVPAPVSSLPAQAATRPEIVPPVTAMPVNYDGVSSGAPDSNFGYQPLHPARPENFNVQSAGARDLDLARQTFSSTAEPDARKRAVDPAYNADLIAQGQAMKVPAPPPTVSPEVQSQFLDALRRKDTATRDRLLKENPILAQMLQNTDASKALGAQPASPAASVLDRTSGFLRNNARGSEKPSMTKAQLAAHERRTGDVHFPALIGVKEGVVNARAMDAGGREIVRKLNDSFPVFAEGYVGGEDIPPAVPVDPMTADIARRGSMATAPSTGAGQAALGQTPAGQVPMVEVPDPSIENPQSVPRLPMGTTHQDKKPDIVADVEEAVKAPRPKMKPVESKTLTSLKEQFDQAISDGKDKKAAALIKARLAEENRLLTRAVNDPAIRKHNMLVDENIKQFLGKASDEELAYYGFDKVLAAKQGRLAREEEGRQNEANRQYMEKTGTAAVKSAALTDAQIKVQLAQAAKYAAEEKLTLSKIGAMDFSGNDDILKDLLSERMKTIKTEDQYQQALADDPNFRLLVDTLAKRGGLPGWQALQKTPGIWERITQKINEKLQGQSSYTTMPSGQPASMPTGPQYDSPDDVNAVMQSVNALFGS